MLHRYIDAYTDRHPLNSEIRDLFPDHLRRYRAICLDLFWDYCLSQAWPVYHSKPREQFIEQHYAVLRLEMNELEANIFPAYIEKADLVLTRMIRYNWLISYSELSNIRLALERIGLRFRRPPPLQQAADVLEHHESRFHAQFEEFFPEVIAFSKETITRL